MNQKKKIIILMIVSLSMASYLYIEKKFNSLGVFIFSLSTSLFLVSAILIFVRESVINLWVKFAGCFLIFAIILFIAFPEINQSFVGFDKKSISLLLSKIFFILSLGIIIFKSFKRS